MDDKTHWLQAIEIAIKFVIWISCGGFEEMPG